jgi:methyl-accepting chemotaxis protein
MAILASSGQLSPLQRLQRRFVAVLSLAYGAMLTGAAALLALNGELLHQPTVPLAALGFAAAFGLNHVGRLRLASFIVCALMTLDGASQAIMTAPFYLTVMATGLIPTGFLFGPWLCAGLTLVELAFAGSLPLWLPGLQWIDTATAYLRPDVSLDHHLMTVASLGAVGWFFGMISRDLSHLLEVEHATLSASEAQRTTLSGWLRRSCDEVAETARSLSGSAESAAHAAHQIALTVDELARGAAIQALEIAGGAEHMAGIKETAGHMAASAEMAVQASSQATTAATDGQAALDRMRRVIGNVDTSVSHAADIVQRLGHLGERIGAIIAMIRTIAQQTNLLALNAAIEAARAGDAGRGFAVVADEVRKLASDSARSAGEITAMVGEIQRETHAAVDAMRTGTADVRQGVELIQLTDQSLGHIVQAVQTTDEAISAILVTSTHLSENLTAVTGNMDAIAAVAEESAASTQDAAEVIVTENEAIRTITATADQLAAMADELNRQIGQLQGETEPERQPQPQAEPVWASPSLSGRTRELVEV